MSFLSKRSLLERIRRSKESRRRLVSSNIDKGIAFQIRATRTARKWSQSDLALESAMTQNNVSRLESPDYGKHTLSSLKRLADAFDVALVVRFVPFSQYVDWLSGTPHLDGGLSPEALAPVQFEEEDRSGRLDLQVRYYPVYVSPIDIGPQSIGSPLTVDTDTKILPPVTYAGHNPMMGAFTKGVA
jgi:transcriptional regulator with XRE-family HTH domain